MRARSFVLRAVAWSVGLFGALRLPWVEAHVVLPITSAQSGIGAAIFGSPVAPFAATSACSGTDALALCVGAILAYPVAWRARLTGAAAGTAMILGINILRIGTLGQAVDSPFWSNALHIYIWPAVLTLAIAGYVMAWMGIADRASAAPALAERPHPSRRFIALSAAFLLVFVAASPVYLESATVLAVAAFIARAASVTLNAAGVNAQAAGNLLITPSGGYLVTQECISTPLIPIYVAAVGAYATSRRWLVLGVLATLPLFVALGIARLLVVALPSAASPSFLVHAFFQLLTGVVIVAAAAIWRHGLRAAAPRAFLGLAAGAMLIAALSPLTSRVLSPMLLNDPQGAVSFLPAFQLGLLLALWIAAFDHISWRRALAGAGVLVVSHAALVVALNALFSHGGLAPAVRDVRGWAVAGPLIVGAVVANVGRARR